MTASEQLIAEAESLWRQIHRVVWDEYANSDRTGTTGFDRVKIDRYHRAFHHASDRYNRRVGYSQQYPTYHEEWASRKATQGRMT